jgi:copper(I)-binding protein
MTRIRAYLLPLLGLLLLAAPASAHSYKAGGLEIGHPWARETPPAAKVGAAYFTVTNTGSEPDRLIAVETPGAEKVEMHESIEDNGVAKMRPVTAIEIPAGKKIELKSGGYHLMLIGLKEALAEGMRIPATFVFEKAGRVDVELAVEPMGYGGPDHHKH